MGLRSSCLEEVLTHMGAYTLKNMRILNPQIVQWLRVYGDKDSTLHWDFIIIKYYLSAPNFKRSIQDDNNRNCESDWDRIYAKLLSTE